MSVSLSISIGAKTQERVPGGKERFQFYFLVKCSYKQIYLIIKIDNQYNIPFDWANLTFCRSFSNAGSSVCATIEERSSYLKDFLQLLLNEACSFAMMGSSHYFQKLVK